MFCDTLKKLRDESNLTQSELANKLNITRSSLSLYELGKRTPDFNTLSKIADFFNVSADYLLGRTNVRNNVETFVAHTDDDLSDEAKAELENFKDYLRNKYSK